MKYDFCLELTPKKRLLLRCSSESRRPGGKSIRVSGSAPIFRPLSEWSQNVVASRHSRHSFGVVSDACFARSFRPLTLRRWRSLGPHCVASLLAPARAHWALWWCSRPTARPGWMCCCTCFAAFAPHPGFGDGAAGAQIFAGGSKFCMWQSARMARLRVRPELRAQSAGESSYLRISEEFENAPSPRSRSLMHVYEQKR